jgi:hypothetical protein
VPAVAKTLPRRANFDLSIIEKIEEYCVKLRLLEIARVARSKGPLNRDK